MTHAPRIVVHRSLRKALDLFNQDRFGWLDRVAVTGPIVEMQLGRAKVWVVTDAAVARQVLLTDEANWLRPSYFRIPTRQAIGDNLFTLSEQRWRLIGPVLSSHFRTPAFEARLSHAAAMIADDVEAWPMDTRIDLDQATSRLALRAASWMLFGDDLSSDRADELVHHQRALMEWLGERIGSPRAVLPLTLGTSGREIKEHRDALDAHGRGIVNKRRKSAPVDDVLGSSSHCQTPGIVTHRRGTVWARRWLHRRRQRSDSRHSGLGPGIWLPVSQCVRCSGFVAGNGAELRVGDDSTLVVRLVGDSETESRCRSDGVRGSSKGGSPIRRYCLPSWDEQESGLLGPSRDLRSGSTCDGLQVSTTLIYTLRTGPTGVRRAAPRDDRVGHCAAYLGQEGTNHNRESSS